MVVSCDSSSLRHDGLWPLFQILSIISIYMSRMYRAEIHHYYYWVPIHISGSLFSVFWVNLREECQFILSMQKLEKTCIIDYRSVCDDSLPFYMVSKNIGTSSVLHFLFYWVRIPKKLGPYWVPISKLGGPY